MLQQLLNLQHAFPGIQAQRAAAGVIGETGVAVALEIRPAGALDYKTIEWKREGIEVLNVRREGETETVILHVPDGRFVALERRLASYLNTETRTGKPAHMTLVNAIECVRNAVFLDLWTDMSQPPQGPDAVWFQVWLRATGRASKDVAAQFADMAPRFGIEVEPGYVSFPGRVIVAARATRNAIQQAVELLDMVAEIRGVSPTAEFFLSDLRPYQQGDWIQNLLERSAPLEGSDSNRVTLLDTGVNAGHPLLETSLSAANMHAYDPAWSVDDRNGHGTEMAGLCLYGNLVSVLAHADFVQLSHQLESVKILPDAGQNAPHLYGSIVTEAVNRVEISAPAARRVFATMTTAEGDTGGGPSEWSATIDQLAFGRPPIEVGLAAEDDDDQRAQRLFVLAGGNVHWPDWQNYPNINQLRTVEDPGQAWNALTVGAATELVDVDPDEFPELKAIAPMGGLAPASRTTVMWKATWPYKPDVVAEGGNGSQDPANNVTVGPESIRLLTTAADMRRAPLCESGDTSAATAEVARLCARLRFQYPEYWPETIRALVVHGAVHTAHMRGTLRLQPTQREKNNFLRTFGHGLVNERRAMSSDFNRPLMIIQEEVQPLQRDGAGVRFGKMVLHDLPWPTDELLQLGETEISLRVTLSYFVEPNPSKRGWQSKFRYQSHGLRFATKGATENDETFLERVNALERDEDDEESHRDPDRDGWAYGYQLRTRGSLHSDVWTGNAADLAAKGKIAVFPVGGWWKDWIDARQWNTGIRYALVLSLEAAEGIDIDLYTPIAARIAVAQEVDLPAAE